MPGDGVTSILATAGPRGYRSGMTGVRVEQQAHTQRRVLLPAVLVVLALVCGFASGAAWQARASNGWRTGQGYVGTDQVTVESGGWSYGAKVSAVEWIDAQGGLHTGDWPTCLTRFVTQSVRFLAASVSVDGFSLRPIVAIDCRP